MDRSNEASFCSARFLKRALRSPARRKKIVIPLVPRFEGSAAEGPAFRSAPCSAGVSPAGASGHGFSRAVSSSESGRLQPLRDSLFEEMPPQLQLVQQERRYYFVGRAKREILFTVLAESLDEARQKFRNAGHPDSDALFIIKTETEIYLA